MYRMALRNQIENIYATVGILHVLTRKGGLFLQIDWRVSIRWAIMYCVKLVGTKICFIGADCAFICASTLYKR